MTTITPLDVASVTQAVKKAIQTIVPNKETTSVPISDGSDGTNTDTGAFKTVTWLVPTNINVAQDVSNASVSQALCLFLICGTYLRYLPTLISSTTLLDLAR